MRHIGLAGGAAQGGARRDVRAARQDGKRDVDRSTRKTSHPPAAAFGVIVVYEKPAAAHPPRYPQQQNEHPASIWHAVWHPSSIMIASDCVLVPRAPCRRPPLHGAPRPRPPAAREMEQDPEQAGGRHKLARSALSLAHALLYLRRRPPPAAVRPVRDRFVSHARIRRGVAVDGGAPRHVHRGIAVHRYTTFGASAARRGALHDVDGRDVQPAGVRGVRVPQGAGPRRAADAEVPGGPAGGLRLLPRVVYLASHPLPRRARGRGIVSRAPPPVLAHLAWACTGAPSSFQMCGREENNVRLDQKLGGA